jgi:hypothetical protein
MRQGNNSGRQPESREPMCEIGDAWKKNKREKRWRIGPPNILCVVAEPYTKMVRQGRLSTTRTFVRAAVSAVFKGQFGDG